MGNRLVAAGVRRECLNVATRSDKWAWLGPGNDGPDGLIVLHNSSEPGMRVILFTQSKLRRAAVSRYAQTAVEKEAAKCSEVGPDCSVLLYLIDEQGKGVDLLHHDTAGGVGMAPVFENARTAARASPSQRFSSLMRGVVGSERGVCINACTAKPFQHLSIEHRPGELPSACLGSHSLAE